MNTHLKTFQDFRNEISIIELALANGYHLVKSAGLKYPVLKNITTDDKIIIVNALSTSNQGYFNPQNDKDKGTLINFVKNRLGSIFPMADMQADAKSINSVLYDYLRIPAPEKKTLIEKTSHVIKHYQERKFILPNGISPLKDISYLRSRGISEKIIFDNIFKDRIFNISVGKFCNIGFPYSGENDMVIGYELRNVNYKRMHYGSDRSNSIWHSNLPGKLESAILTESPIDALSYHQLKGKTNTAYIAFGGTVTVPQLNLLNRIISALKLSSEFKFYSAVDNDTMGYSYFKKFKLSLPFPIIKDFPLKKDYNDVLRNVSSDI